MQFENLICPICKSTTFAKTNIGTINACEGYFNVNAYACQKCGHLELFNPSLDIFAIQEREQYEIMRQQEEQELKQQEVARQKRIKELEYIINNEDSTIRQVNEAKKELNEIRRNNIPSMIIKTHNLETTSNIFL